MESEYTKTQGKNFVINQMALLLHTTRQPFDTTTFVQRLPFYLI